MERVHVCYVAARGELARRAQSKHTRLPCCTTTAHQQRSNTVLAAVHTLRVPQSVCRPCRGRRAVVVCAVALDANVAAAATPHNNDWALVVVPNCCSHGLGGCCS